MGFVLVALLGGCLGMLVAQVVQTRLIAKRRAEEAAQQHMTLLALTERHHAELRAQITTMTAELVEQAHLVGGALAAEMRATNAERRNDARLALGLSRVSVPGEKAPVGALPSGRRAPSRPAGPARPTVTICPITSDGGLPTPVLPLCTGEESTPQSGWALDHVRARAEVSAESRSS